jgi:hypothetical protein
MRAHARAAAFGSNAGSPSNPQSVADMNPRAWIGANVGPAAPPIPAAPPGASWWVLSGGAACAVDSSGLCVTDGAGQYDANERCTFQALRNLTILAEEFATQAGSDVLTVHSSVDGALPFSGTTVAPHPYTCDPWRPLCA